MPEKFSTLEVINLRNDLLHCGLDNFQVAESIKMFVARRGYGISSELARDVATQLENRGAGPEWFHHQLENSALAM